MIELESRSRSARTISTVLRGIIFAGLTLVAACGKNGTGPDLDDNDNHGPEKIAPKTDLSGAWTLNIAFGNDQAGLSCNGQAQVRLQHSGNSIAGEYTSGSVTCTIQGQSESGDVTGSFTGTISGDQVTFEEDGGGFRFTGVISSDRKRMQGSLSAMWDVGPDQQLPLTGDWSASR
jgi:hypothetical protein